MRFIITVRRTTWKKRIEGNMEVKGKDEKEGE